MIEIELKAHVSDPGHLREILGMIAIPGRLVVKSDMYWNLPDIGSSSSFKERFRIRMEGSNATVTRKIKHLVGETEVNQEIEFSVSDPEAFLDLMQHVGCTKSYEKKKISEQYISGRILAELVNIEKLGYFLELEILASDDNSETIKTAQQELLAFLKLCNINTTEIETKYYSELLGK